MSEQATGDKMTLDQYLRAKLQTLQQERDQTLGNLNVLVGRVLEVQQLLDLLTTSASEAAEQVSETSDP